MKYGVGDRVRIKSLNWYNENKDEVGIIIFSTESGDYNFTKEDSRFCGRVVTITYARKGHYLIAEDNRGYFWIDEMIEGLAEEETKPNIIEEAKTYWDNIKDAWICPEGYIFKDENGNIINARKIVLEKKKKEYPKTFNECCSILNTSILGHIYGYAGLQLEYLQKLIICRNAYWKIAGEEMGLGKLWKPTKDDSVFSISRMHGKIGSACHLGECCIFEFPTKEMRDAFKENFDAYLCICEELL